MIGREALAADFESVGVDEASEAANQFHTRLGQVTQIPLVEIAHEAVTSDLQLAPIEIEIVQPETVAGRIVERMGQIGGMPHHFLGHAADIDARSTEAASFDQSATGIVMGRSFRNGQTAAATADRDEIVMLHHEFFFAGLKVGEADEEPGSCTH